MVNGIGYGSYGAYSAYSGLRYGISGAALTGRPEEELSNAQIRNLKRTGAIECETCKNRQYQDGSNEADVSFKSPGHITPQASAARVMAHEQEHVVNAYEKAEKGDGKVVAANVKLMTAVCPECGRSYVAGGETNTMIKYNEDNPYGKAAKSQDAAKLIGRMIDYAV
ncbi:MAG: hypothetical protein NC086_03490 [Alistipes sp.]|nr:hypothetical protein [Alistipes sp.]